MWQGPSWRASTLTRSRGPWESLVSNHRLEPWSSCPLSTSSSIWQSYRQRSSAFLITNLGTLDFCVTNRSMDWTMPHWHGSYVCTASWRRLEAVHHVWTKTLLAGRWKEKWLPWPQHMWMTSLWPGPQHGWMRWMQSLSKGLARWLANNFLSTIVGVAMRKPRTATRSHSPSSRTSLRRRRYLLEKKSQNWNLLKCQVCGQCWELFYGSQPPGWMLSQMSAFSRAGWRYLKWKISNMPTSWFRRWRSLEKLGSTIATWSLRDAELPASMMLHRPVRAGTMLRKVFWFVLLKTSSMGTGWTMRRCSMTRTTLVELVNMEDQCMCWWHMGPRRKGSHTARPMQRRWAW